METASTAGLVALIVVISITPTPCLAQTIIDSDFSRGDFAALGWKAKGDWDLFRYPKEAANNPGVVARFPARKPNGSLTKTFAEIRNPRKLTLSLDYGWGWGDTVQGADSVSWMLLDAGGNGYVFEVHRCKARWAVQWGRVANNIPSKDRTWASEEIDASHPSVRNGGGLSRLAITREGDAVWSIGSKDWNKGAGATVKFIDATTNSFSRLVLLGTENFDEQVFSKIVLELAPAAQAAPTTAIPVTDFLNSIGVVSTFPDRGQPLPKTIQMVKYVGFRWVRGGIEGLTAQGPTTLQTYLDLHEQTGARFSWGLVGAIHGRLLTAWSAAGVAGPVLVNYIREFQIEHGVAKAEAYTMTMCIMAALLLVGLVCNFRVRAVGGDGFEPPSRSNGKSAH